MFIVARVPSSENSTPSTARPAAWYSPSSPSVRACSKQEQVAPSSPTSSRNVFIGAMSGDTALRSPLFRHPGKLIITSGDRSDMVLASLEGDTAAVVLTNNVVPPANIVARATERGVPLVLVSQDTYQVAAQIDRLEPLLTREEGTKHDLLGRLVRESVQLAQLLPGTPAAQAAGKGAP